MSSHVGEAPGLRGASGDGVDRKRVIREAVQDVFSRRRLTRTATSGLFNKFWLTHVEREKNWTQYIKAALFVLQR